MEFARILRRLWTLRRWVAVGAVVALLAAVSTAFAVSLFPPSLESKSHRAGAASTELLIDTPNSPLGDIGIDLAPLTQRAETYSQFLKSEPVQRAIERELGVPHGAVQIDSKSSLSQPRTEREPAAEERANSISTEGTGYRLLFSAQVGVPIIDMSALAPSGDLAKRLADAAATGIQSYFVELQEEQRIPPPRRVEIRQLGKAQGGDVVSSEVDLVLAVLTFIGVLIVMCLLILFVANVVTELRRLPDEDAEAEAPVSLFDANAGDIHLATDDSGRSEVVPLGVDAQRP